MNKKRYGNIPVLSVSGENLPDAWEKAVLAVWEHGIEIKTEYDKPEDPPSKDATVMIEVKDPFGEPRIHKNFPGGLQDLELYRQEMVDGIHDHWIDPEAGKWTYTYHARLTDYDEIDQIEQLVNKLVEAHYTRRAQAITWMPNFDPFTDDPPCFVGGTLISTPNGKKQVENLNAGDAVYAFDLVEQKLHQRKVETPFKKKEECVRIHLQGGRVVEVSEQQRILTDNDWATARNLKNEDLVAVSSSCTKDGITDWMLAGYLFGDGWLSSSKNSHGDAYRGELCFSIHPDADRTGLRDWLAEFSDNKINDRTKYCNSEVASGLSRKVRLYDKKLWEKFRAMGCPIGRKDESTGEVKIDIHSLSDKNAKDFLTGIWSAEGSIVSTSSHSLSFQLGMVWSEAITFISQLLDRFGIEYKRYSGDVDRILIGRADEIRKTTEIFDFRLDSRKQARWLKMLADFEESDMVLAQRKAHVEKIQKLKDDGGTHRELRKLSPFNPRMLKKGYKFHESCARNESRLCWLPVTDVEKIGTKTVYDFGVDYPSHAILANQIVSHNCLQRIWCRIMRERNGKMVLNMNTHWRSRDLYKAWFMNAYAITALQRIIAEMVAERMGCEVHVGRYVDISDSLHIYGSYFEEVTEEIEKMKKSSYEERAWNTQEPVITQMIEETKARLREDPDFMKSS